MSNYLNYIGQNLSETMAKMLFPGEWILGEAVGMGKKDLILKILAVADSKAGVMNLFNELTQKYPERRLVVISDKKK